MSFIKGYLKIVKDCLRLRNGYLPFREPLAFLSDDCCTGLLRFQQQAVTDYQANGHPLPYWRLI